MTYTAQEFLQDAKGYGHVLAAFSGADCIGGNPARIRNTLRPDQMQAFVGSLYAYVKARPGIVVYRWFDDDKGAFLGGWWSPRRPAAEIDGLGLDGTHRRSRHHLAIKHDWNKMQQVLEANVRTGTMIIVGRVAEQSDSPHRLAGGAIQFLVPRESFAGLHLTRRHEYR